MPRAIRVEQRNWEEPDPHEWVATLAATIAAASRPTLLIAHSLGCIAVSRLPAPIREKVAGALLVAPADIERPDTAPCLRSFKSIPMQSLPFQSVVVASTNDPCCSLGRAKLFAQAWGSRFEEIENAGHINAESGYGQWPEGLKILAALRRRAHWRVPIASQRTPPLLATCQPPANSGISKPPPWQG